MRHFVRHVGAVLCLFASLAICGATLLAQRDTTATFASAVQLPGLLLPAGSYHFLLARDGRTVVVSSAEGRVLISLQVSPTTRSQGGPIVTLRPAVGDAAPEVSALYSNGGTTGVSFIYRPAQK